MFVSEESCVRVFFLFSLGMVVSFNCTFCFPFPLLPNSIIFYVYKSDLLYTKSISFVIAGGGYREREAGGCFIRG